ncbi:MAG: hypothetical protein AAF721_22710 [Myxococcota bacterium]
MKRGLVLTALLVTACAHGGKGREVELSNEVVVVFEDTMKKVPFDTREVRLKQASEQLAAIAGHRIEFHIDRAVLPRYEDVFEEMLADSIEAVAKDMRQLGERITGLPELSQTLARIEIKYDVAIQARRGIERELDVDTKTLTIRVDGEQYRFVPEGLVYATLRDAIPEVLRRKFGGKRPAEVAVADYGWYLEYLDDAAEGSYGDPPSSTAELERHPDLETLALAQDLHSRVEDPELHAEVGKWIAKHGANLFYGYLDKAPQLATSVSKNGAYARGQLQWARWVHANMWDLTEGQRFTLMGHVFPRDVDAHPALPGLEPMRVGFAVADRWIADGHEGPTQNRSPGTTYNNIVCPVDLVSEDRHPFPNNCRVKFYRQVWTDEASKKTFVRALVKRDDDALYRAAAAAIHEIGGADALLELWQRLDRNEKAWRAVGREAAVLDVGNELLDDIQAMWRRAPKRRGTLLFVLAIHARRGHKQKTFWPTFREDFGVVDAATFRSFLGHGPLALATAWVTWPALGRFDRGAPVASHLDALFDAASTGPFDNDGFKPPTLAITALLDNMCQSGTAAERRKVKAALDARARKKPDEAHDLSPVIRRAGC